MGRAALLLLLPAICFGQGVITTVTGTDYVFPDDGQPALKARLVAPSGLVVDDSSGDLFVADSGLNMVLRIDSKGVIHVAAGNGVRANSGDDGPARAASLAGASDIAGNSTTRYIADFFGTRVRKVTAGIITTAVGIPASGFSGDGGPATRAQVGTVTGVAVDRAGNLYIADPNNARVRKVDLNGIITTFAGNGQNATAGDGGPATAASLAFANRVATDPAGNVYISQGDGRIRKVAPNGIISTFAQNLAQPMGMAMDAKGNLLVCEQNFERIVSIGPDSAVTVIAGSGVNGFADGPVAQAAFSRPTAIDVDSAGNIYVADQDNGRIRRIANGNVQTIAGAGVFTGDGGPATDARLNFPQGLTTDGAGNLYIADSQNNRIRKVTRGEIISTAVGNGRQGSSQDGTPGAAALINNPQAVAFSPQGELVFAEGGKIRKLNASGAIVTIGGTGFSGSSGDGGPALQATITFVSAITYDGAGNLYIAEQARVRKISPAGIITAFAGNGQIGNSGDGGPATSANFSMIRGLAVDPSGNLYIGDYLPDLVRKVDKQGIVTTVAGSGKSGFSLGPGPGTSIPLNGVWGLAADRSGNIFISENSGEIVRKLDPNGTLTIYAGSTRPGNSGDGGPALAATFDNLNQIYCDSAGNLYLSDMRAGRIRVIQAGPSPSISVSQKGATFNAVAGGGPPEPQSFSIVNSGGGPLAWGVTALTASGGDWLSVTPANGISPAGAAGPPVQVSVNPAGLPPDDYYGQILVRGYGAPNSPQSLLVVLNVRPAGTARGANVRPAGLLFLATATGSNPASQVFSLNTLSASPVAFTSTATSAQNWFTLAPASGSVSPGKPVAVQVVPGYKSLPAGVYPGVVNFTFSDNTSQTVQVLLVISSSSPGQPNAPGVRTAGCAPTRLLPLFTSIGSGFSLTTGWPSPVELVVVDDCGQPMTAGSVTASFSNTDPTLPLNSLGDGRWTGTWQAQNSLANVSVTVNAVSPDNSVSGTAQITGGLSRNANPPPSVAAGGVLNAASYQLQAPLAPGSLISIFGTLLAQGSVSAPALPLTNTLGGSTVTIAGRPLPLLFTGASQINAMIPYDLPINATHQLIVQRGTAISVPQPISVLASQSGVFTKDLTGQGTGIVVKVAADGTQTVVDAGNPVTAGDAIVIYCAGLGDVTPRLVAGQQAPLSPLATTLEGVTVTIGGVNAPVFFAGVTPGFTGLYQVNAFVPAGVKGGGNVPLLISQSGRTSPPVAIPVR